MTTFTTTSPTTAGELPAGVTEIGGIVLDLIGINGVRVVCQLPASSLFVGMFHDGTPAAYRGNPGTIGIQEGFSTVLTALGGGLSEVAIPCSASRIFAEAEPTGSFFYKGQPRSRTCACSGISAAEQEEELPSSRGLLDAGARRQPAFAKHLPDAIIDGAEEELAGFLLVPTPTASRRGYNGD